MTQIWNITMASNDEYQQQRSFKSSWIHDRLLKAELDYKKELEDSLSFVSYRDYRSEDKQREENFKKTNK